MFVRLFSKILDSSIRDADVEVRWLFIVMLILGDEQGEGVIEGTISALAARAGMSVEQTRKALTVLMAPDPNSSSPEEDGRRVLPIDPTKPERDWTLVNWRRYKTIARKEQLKASWRKASATYRKNRTFSTLRRHKASAIRQQDVINSPLPSDTSEALKSDTPKASEWIPPTVDEVAAQIRKKGFVNVDAGEFVRYWSRQDWISPTTGRRLRNWKTALANREHDLAEGRGSGGGRDTRKPSNLHAEEGRFANIPSEQIPTETEK